MRHLVYFLWLLPLAGLCLAIAVWGTPHIVGSYTYAGSRYLPPAERHYATCTYYGWAGVITINAIDATCPWVHFLKAGTDQ